MLYMKLKFVSFSPLEIFICMVSCLPMSNVCFRTKTMDYSQGNSFHIQYITPHWKVLQS